MQQTDKQLTLYFIETRDDILFQMDKVRMFPNLKIVWDGYRKVLKRGLRKVYNEGYQKGLKDGAYNALRFT